MATGLSVIPTAQLPGKIRRTRVAKGLFAGLAFAGFTLAVAFALSSTPNDVWVLWLLFGAVLMIGSGAMRIEEVALKAERQNRMLGK